jgi:hypothetical protein
MHTHPLSWSVLMGGIVLMVGGRITMDGVEI